MQNWKIDGLVKSPTAAPACALHGDRLSFIFRHCGVPVSTPHSSRFASLVFGALYFAVPILAFYEFIKLETKINKGLYLV